MSTRSCTHVVLSALLTIVLLLCFCGIALFLDFLHMGLVLKAFDLQKILEFLCVYTLLPLGQHVPDIAQLRTQQSTTQHKSRTRHEMIRLDLAKVNTKQQSMKQRHLADDLWDRRSADEEVWRLRTPACRVDRQPIPVCHRTGCVDYVHDCEGNYPEASDESKLISVAHPGTLQHCTVSPTTGL